MKISRSRAADIIENVRVMIAIGLTSADISRLLKEKYDIAPLERCEGSAHSNPHIDNCLQCAPRWGWTGEKVEVT
jgi:hypothetical protein